MAKKGFTTLDELEDYYQKYGDKSYILNKLKHVRGWNKQGDKPVDDKIITPTNINTQTGGGHDPNVHGPIDYGRGSDGRQSYDFGQGFGAHATSGGPVSNRTGRGRQDWAQGGRAGYAFGRGPVLDENINVEGPGFDINENVMMASDDTNTRILENLFEHYLDLGFSPAEAEKLALEEFESMAQGSGQGEGIASLV